MPIFVLAFSVIRNGCDYTPTDTSLSLLVSMFFFEYFIIMISFFVITESAVGFKACYQKNNRIAIQVCDKFIMTVCILENKLYRCKKGIEYFLCGHL